MILSCLLLLGCNQQKNKNTSKKEFKFRTLTQAEKTNYRMNTFAIYKNLFGNNFSGAILVAKNGQIVFEKYNGFFNYSTKQLINQNTPIHIASVSKPITALAVLQLVEKKLLRLEDTLQQYFPLFPYTGVTIQQLLNHRSGLPNYLYFMDTTWNKKIYATNNDVLQFMIDKHPDAYAKPDKVFHYCNTNYILLALIVEKITEQSFPKYVQDYIFLPNGMKHSYVFSIQDTSNYTPSYQQNNNPYNLESLDCIYGDKNVYTTVRDLLLLDKAIYNNSIVSKTTYNTAILPYSHEKQGNKNYGLGWRLHINHNDTIVYHGGWWHGNNSLFTRLIKDTATIITLGNKYNRSIYNTKQIASLFTNKEIGEIDE